VAGYSAHGFHSVWEISCVASDVLVSQVGFCSIELFSKLRWCQCLEQTCCWHRKIQGVPIYIKNEIFERFKVLRIFVIYATHVALKSRELQWIGFVDRM
jgi:hypothetical protein